MYVTNLLPAHKYWSYFPTPDPLIFQMMEWAQPKYGNRILEPSAGQGHLARWIQLLTQECQVDVCEIVPAFHPLLKRQGLNLVGTNFMGLPVSPAYDLVVANPPYDRQMSHIRRMYQHLVPGGRVVTLANTRWRYETTNRQGLPAAIYSEFRAWLKAVKAKDIPLPPGSFQDAERSTDVEVCILVIDKP